MASNKALEQIEKELDRCELIMAEGDWIEAPGREEEEADACFFWENFKEGISFLRENPDVYPYTLIEVEGNTYLVRGLKIVNRFAYMFSRVSLPMGGDDELLYWSDEYGTNAD